MSIRPFLISFLLCLAVAVGWKTGVLPLALVVVGLRGVAIGTLLLAARFGRGTAVWLCSALALAAESHRWSGLSGASSELMVSSFVALDLALAGVVGERRSKWRTLGLFALLGVEVLLVAAPTESASKLRLVFEGELARLPVGAGLVLVALTLTFVGWRFVHRREVADGGLLVTILMVAIAELRPGEAELWLGLAVLSVAVSALESAFALAYRDGLTGLRSRRSFDEKLRSLPASYVIAMVDIDHFKRVNDRYGHDVGDQVLRKVASELATCGVAFRYGGEEFVLVFANQTISEVKKELEVLRSGIAAKKFVVRSARRGQRRVAHKSVSKSLRATVSIGAAARGPKRRRAEDVIKAADRALYRAKRAGRNRVSVVNR